MNFSGYLKTLMAQRRYKLTSLAAQIGCSPSYLCDLLKGRRRWNEELMTKACQALGIEIIYRPTGTED